MAQNQSLVNRVYDIKVQGTESSLKNVQALTAAFNKLDQTKRKTDEQLQKAVAAGNAEAVSKLTARIAELETAMKNLDKQRQQSAKEAEILARAEKLSADAELQAAKAAAVRAKSLSDQDKELDRQIANQQRRNKQQADSAKAVGENYYALLKAFREAQEAYRLFDKSTGDSAGFEKVKREAVDAKKKLDEFSRTLSPDGTLVGEYKTGILNALKNLGLSDVLKRQRDDINNQLGQIIQKNRDLVVAYKQAQAAGGDAFSKIDTELKHNIEHQQKLEANLHAINSTLNDTNSIGSQVVAGISQGFKNLKNDIAQVLLGYVGFQAAVSGVRNLIHQNAELSDSIGQLQIYLHGSKDAAENLVESLKKLDTRTSLASLVDIATIVAKKGVAADQITGVTKALDQLFVVLGKEAGDPHEAVSSLVKLVNVYSEDKHVTADNIGNIGAAIQKLTSSGVATGRFLIDFSERLAGVRGITGVSIQNVLGLGAAIQELGQRSETASTASSQLIIKIFADVPKYAAVAGKSVAEFTKTLNESPVEALIQVAEGLKKDKASLEEIASAFTAAGIHGARVVGVLGDIAGNAEYMRKRVRDANAAFGDQASILAANEIKQHTFAATLDRIAKQFELIGANRTFQVLLGSIASLLALILTNLGPIITVLAFYAAGWAVANQALIIQRGQLILVNVQLLAGRIALAAITITQTLFTAAVWLLNAAVTAANATLRLFGVTIGGLPLKIILGLLGLSAVAFKAFSKSLDDASEAVKRHNIALQLNKDIQAQVAKAVADQELKAKTLANVVKDLTISEQTRRKALQDLITIDPVFQKTLVDGKINIGNLNQALLEYNSNLEKKATLEAAQATQSSQYNRLVQLQNVRTSLEIKKSTGGGTYQSLTDDEKEAFSLNGLDKATIAIFGKTKISDKDFTAAIRNLNEEIKQQGRVVDEATKIYASLYKQQNTPAPAGSSPKQSVFDRFKELVDNNGTEADFKTLLQQIETQKKSTAVASKEYKDLLDLQKKVQDLIKPKNPTSGGASKLTAEQKDQFKEIDAARDLALAEEKLRRTKNEVDEATYLGNMLTINQKYIDQKLSLLKGKQKPEEKKVYAELQLDRITQEQETNKKLFDILAKRAQDDLNQAKRSAEAQRDLVVDNPNSTESARSAARQEANFQLLAAQHGFNTQMNELERKYVQQSKDNELERAQAIRAITKQIKEERLGELNAEIKDKQKFGDDAIGRANQIFDAARLSIINSKKSNNKKESALSEIDTQQQASTLSIETATMEKQLPIYQSLLAKKQISDKEYADFYEKYVSKIAELQNLLRQNIINATKDDLFKNINDVPGLIRAGVTSVFKTAFVPNANDSDDDIKKKAELRKVLGDTLQQTYATAQNAMQSYFDVERQSIENSLKLKERQLDAEKRVTLGKAQSAAEQDTIERQFAAKKLAAEKEAFEKNKKMQIAQAEINLATQLSNLAVIAFAPNPLNIATLGAAGAIMYGVQAALALVNFGLNVTRINAAQFARGGRVADVGNGLITTDPNMPATSNGDNIFATVKKGEVILNESQQRAMGGPAAFAAAGVPGFAGGGIAYRPLGDFPLGERLQAPFNPGAFLGTAANQPSAYNAREMAELKSMVASTSQQVADTAQQVRNIKVQVVSREMTAQQRKDSIQSQIGRL
ncbi:phage tail tape measure protein [Deminuibacter soli]|uniref:Phage tail tape measure protein domain-containing protein n=1 Tax=Deminuibacter soli TaxID=2291815 RepID=A0A3E1NQ04_9BACT|nr:phage tail tape measure protein [Deminuibacter soli]RFM30029.1 hypothetical protein DXN05_03395 [Deminuibacter soli]